MTAHPNSREPEGVSEDIRRHIAIADCLAFGAKLMREERGEAFTRRQLIWRLMQEAAETEKALRSDGPRSGSGSIEYYFSPQEIRQVENQWTKDQISYPPRVPKRATESEVWRHGVVVGWLRFIRSHKVAARRKMLFMMAAGMTAERVAESGLYAVPNAKAAEAAKIRCLNSIIDGINALGIDVPEGEIKT